MTRKLIDDRSIQSMQVEEENTVTWEKRRPALLFCLLKAVQESKIHLESGTDEEEGPRNEGDKITFYFSRSSGNQITSLELECSELEYTEAYTRVMDAIRKEKQDNEARDQRAISAAWASLTPAQQRKLITQHLENS